MIPMNVTQKLIREILYLSKKPISKVRLAKVVYFSFKALVRGNFYSLNDLAFIRMPLGPVPINFNEALSSDSDILVQLTDVGLTYNRTNYSLRKGASVKSKYLSYLDKVLQKLNEFPTSTLVEVSHKDYSWKEHLNGDEYFLLKKDLPIEVSGIKVLTEAFDNQLIQSKLVRGMKTEIAQDNSSLEYPENYSSEE